MDPRFSPVWIVAFSVPVLILMAVALASEQLQRRRDRAGSVVMTWDDLRLTPSHLIVGSRRDAPRIPLSGLTAVVETADAPGGAGHDDMVRMTIENAGHEIRRSQPYSYGASGNAQAFAIKFNQLSDQTHAVPGLSDHSALVDRWNRRVA